MLNALKKKKNFASYAPGPGTSGLLLTYNFIPKLHDRHDDCLIS